MDDKICVRVRHSEQHIQEKKHSHFDIESSLIAVNINVLSLDIFKHEIRLAGGCYASIEQFCDVRVGQMTKDAPFPSESVLSTPAHESDVQKLHRYPAFKPPISPLGEPDISHAALSHM